ncbi:hypothetical protein EST38_g10040 [Candolleomyces aberdarensis]|uniref:Cytochrome P450 n=1 Tax=Candolleomyces aberdarensis TaxID=2316362 RepID=A0A4Q2DA51_9AGAR|nr:hypothetical protein EST38_g10040 [Candolleomyces aberdarensis]
MPSCEPWKTYARWGQDYKAPVISFRVYNRHIVVLNTAESMTNLLEKKADIYSDRPMSWMYNVICDRGKAIFNISSSDPHHKQYRKLLQTGLGIRAIRGYLPLIQRESRRLAQGLLQNPDDFVTHVQRNSAAVIMKVAFGYTIRDDDPFIQVANEASKISGWATEPGRWLVDHHPIIRFIPSWFPGAGWKRQGLAWRDRLRYLAEIPHQWIKEQMEAGTHSESFTSKLLRPDGRERCSAEEEEVIKWCAGALYAGAGDTTVAAIISFILLMALNPEVQKKAQQEIRDAFGDALWDILEQEHHSTGNMTMTQAPPIRRTEVRHEELQDNVDLSRISRLPYLNAIMKEVLRFAPVGNLALPHRVTEEDTYGDYRIPKNATVIGNVWAVMHDPNMYPDPFTFAPERFIRSQFTSEIQPDPRQWAFGFGKRACPGTHFAETTMLFAMFNILSQSTISLPKETSRPALEYTTGITSHIKPFPIVVEHRN